MKKINSTLLLFVLVLTFLGLSYVASARVAIGSRSEEVKAIQEILKTDSDVYPEGYVTGYYGSLTEKAIKKLQKKCGLPETGEIDDETEKCIYPINYKVTVVSPNGGEVWDRNTIQTIKWDVTEPEVSIQSIKPIWSMASIDLFRKAAITMPCAPTATVCPPVEQSVFVKHIATVNLFDKSYSWKVGSDIPNRNDYVIRVSVGKNIASLWMWEKNQVIQPSSTEIWPPGPIPPVGRINWDESDRFFEITGTITPECPTCPVCQCPDAQKLEKVITILQNMIAELQKAIALLK